MINIRPKPAALVCLTLIVIISVLAWAILRTNRLESAAQELALAVAEGSFTADYPASLLSNSHPDYQAQISQESLLRYLNNVKQIFGPLDSLVSIRGSSDIPLLPIGNRTASANYEIELSFLNTPASVQLELLLSNGQWLVSKFDIVAEMLAN